MRIPWYGTDMICAAPLRISDIMKTDPAGAEGHILSAASICNEWRDKMNGPEPFPHPIYVTQPLLPDLQDYCDMLRQVWESRLLTNNGPMAKRLESELAKYLCVPHLSLFSNGTIALQIACRLLRLKGEVITTPFTFAATTHALYLNDLKPVFCDVEEETLTMDPDRVEELITPDTCAILPVHVYGNPCKVERLQKIADKHGLKIIYDAAHAFGVEIDGIPVGSYGDISMFSLHATKIYHTIEGGALAFKSPGLKERSDQLRNFGIVKEDHINEPGTNGKLNEIQAAMGLLLLDKVDEEIIRRKEITYLYRDLLRNVPGIRTGEDQDGVKHNYPYFVIRVDHKEYGLSRDELQKGLREYNVFSRRYFYPLCSHFRCYRDLYSARAGNLPVAERSAEEVLVLPLYGGLKNEDVEKICSVIGHIRSGGNG
jgi:dTDP-4-amino-4,6-dideoxygalactose transaminase